MTIIQKGERMSDLISRQAAIDALGDMVMNWTDSDYELGQLNQWKADRKAIIDLPSAQPEVVYCKKCKHWTRTCGDEQWGLGDCDVFDKHLVMCNGYCAWAERKDDE